MRTVLFAGGGTAGHVFPALAVARTLQALAPDVHPLFVGTRERLEGRLVPEAGFDLHHLDVLPIPRRPSVNLFRVPGALMTSVKRVQQLIVESGAVAAVTFGGYVSFPLDWAAAREHLPLVIHEQNSVPGLANRYAARWADRVAVTFPGSVDRFPDPERTAVTGNPVREEMLALDVEAERERAIKHFKLHKNRRTVLVFGGSQGARSLNEAVVASYPHWSNPNRTQILHAAGQQLYREAAARWERARAAHDGPLVRCVDFIDDMALAYATADVVVCRSGATSIAELTALGLPAVLVPYPHATRDHQLENARALAQAGAARVIEDDEVDGTRIVAAVQPWIDDPEAHHRVAAASRAFGRRDAAERVARLVLELLDRVRPASAAEAAS